METVFTGITVFDYNGPQINPLSYVQVALANTVNIQPAADYYRVVAEEFNTRADTVVCLQVCLCLMISQQQCFMNKTFQIL